jgi:hypothetical protein
MLGSYCDAHQNRRLAESSNPNDLMFPILEESAGRLSYYDLAGLWLLAAAGAC